MLVKGLSINSPTSRLAATEVAAYTFSTASLHTPQRPSPPESRSETRTDPRVAYRLDNRTEPRPGNPGTHPATKTRTAKRCDWFAVASQTFYSPLLPQTPAPTPRLGCRVGRACRGRVRRVCRPEVRLGVRWGSLRGSLRYSTCLPERLPTRKRGTGRKPERGALWGSGRGEEKLNVLRDRCCEIEPSKLLLQWHLCSPLCTPPLE